MRKYITLLAIVLAVMVSAIPVSAQTIATNTTLSAAITSTATTVRVASATGFTVGNYLYTGYEEMQITSVSGTTIGVLRGQGGTPARAHASSDVVVTGGIGHFQTHDPDFKAACTRGTGQASVQPYVNVLTGNIWVCTLTSVWAGTNTAPITWNSINLTP